MAEKTVSNTKIYLDTRRLLDEILDVTENFPRYHKYSVGTKMHEINMRMLNIIAKAYLNRERETRINLLLSFLMEFETLKTLVRVAGERQWIKGRGRHAHIIELMDAIQRQAMAWKNSLTKPKNECQN